MIKAGKDFAVLAENALGEYVLGSAAGKTIVREVVNAMWSIEEGGPEARERVSRALALVKDVDD